MYPFEFDSLSADDLAQIEAALPESLEPVVSLIGLRFTLALVRDLGGQRVTFPKSENGPASVMFRKYSEIVGEEAVMTLASYFAGDDFSVPRCIRLDAMFRNIQMALDFDELVKGMSATRAVNELAEKYRLSWRQIEVIVNGKAGALPVQKRICIKNRGESPAGMPWPDEKTKVVSAALAAKLLGISKKTVNGYCRTGLLRDAKRDLKNPNSPWEIPLSSLTQPRSEPSTP